MSTTTHTVSESTKQLVVFSLGEEEYALPITHVQEIIRYAEPRGVASQTPWVKGVISLRGKIVPVYDLAARLGLRAGTEAHKIVIVDDVEEVLTVDAAQLDAVPAAGADFIDAVAKIDDRLVVLLDLDGLFAGVDVAEAAAA